MKRIIFGAMAAAAMLSCAKEQVIEQNRANDEITFSIVAENQTKAAAVYCNNFKPTSFNVYANHAGQTYIDGDVIVQEGTKWVNTSGVRYWPEAGNVTFYAHVNAGNCFQGDVTTPIIKDFEVPTAVGNQKDLLYAVKSQAKGNATVTLNFRHALSQIVFQAKNTNNNLYAEIYGVTICNLGNKNTFTYPAGDTDDTIENHDGNGETTTIGEWGTWNNLTGGNTDYNVTFETVAVPCDGTVKSLTNTNDLDKEYSSKAMLLLPQTTTAWDPETTPKAEDAAGTYFLVNCKICNVAGDSYASNDVVLHNGNVAIPVYFAWEQGKKYIYTFVFGNGNGGYEPDPDDPNTPQAVLLPITFDITVDDFVPVENEDVPMEF